MENVKFAVYDPISGTNSNLGAPIGLLLYQDEVNRIWLMVGNDQKDCKAYLVNDFHEQDWDVMCDLGKDNILDILKEYLATQK